ncbi:uncharacterized protein DS421_3g88600 [Arachis hypogaea]|nr:uncharacterized protein DS421_3g88600 [Arachis hypogaea]
MNNMWKIKHNTLYCGNALARALVIVPVPPPTSTKDSNPSNTPLHLSNKILETNGVSFPWHH